ncbi:MAG: phospholipase D family protein [Bacteroidota bacterium]
MEIQLLGQGYEKESVNSVGNHLIKLLASKEFKSFTAISAFISQAGITGLSRYISKAKKHLNAITIITGVDQKGTSKEALEALLELDINAYVFYQPSITIFHPKIYLFEGEKKSVLIIGSSNLTAQGLFSNIEASLLLQIEDDKDQEIIAQLKEYYKGLFDLTEPNLKELSKKLIKGLVKAKVVPTEKERKAIQDKAKKFSSKEAEKIIYRIFPKRAIAKIPSEFRKPRKAAKKKVKKKAKEQKATKSKYNKLSVLWESSDLTQRDLNIPTGGNTNPTGSMLFKKGKNEGIDQRHFFRDEVFSSLSWENDPRKNLSHLERARAIFKIIVEGEEKGAFELKLTHNSRTDTKTYKQKNSMTQISWGEAKGLIAKKELLGKTVKLYKEIGKDNQFVLVFE